MNKKGFTLIELLTVIVILAVIALIITPIVSNIISNTKKQAVKQSAMHLIEAGENYVAKKMLDENGNSIAYPIAFTCDGTNCTSGSDTLPVSGDIPKSGKVVIESERNIYVTNIAASGDKCLFGTKTTLAEGNCVTINPVTPVNVSNDYGLFDYAGNLLVSWNDLVNVYGFDISKDYTEANASTSATSGTRLFATNNWYGVLKVPPIVTRIGEYVFYNNSGLITIYIPDEVLFVGKSAFKGCNDLMDVVFENIDNWYANDSATEGGGDDIDLYNSGENAINLSSSNGSLADLYLKRR